MKKQTHFAAALALLILMNGRYQASDKTDQIFQVSTLNALSAGQFDGIVPYPRLKTLGDFGVGTFDHLDGEMVAVDGEFYRIRTDGAAHPVEANAKAPFADVTFFSADRTLTPDVPLSYEQLLNFLSLELPDAHAFYALRIDGYFQQLTLRSVPPQQKPYPTLAEALEQQVKFSYEDIEGTMVGMYMPADVAGTGIPGFHFHFISKDRKLGGHVLECLTSRVNIGVDDCDGISLIKSPQKR